jgi:hypothetical protein
LLPKRKTPHKPRHTQTESEGMENYILNKWNPEAHRSKDTHIQQ